jgi:riboflavin synthase
MFTGIVTDLGRVLSIGQGPDPRIRIRTRYDLSTVEIGASISCSGCCLTVVDKGEERGEGWFAAQASAETFSKTTLGRWRMDSPVNLERALKVGDELGGHIVTGHVDGVGTCESARPEGLSMRIVFKAPPSISPFIAAKGSVAVDGVSLTVNEVSGHTFGVNIIPHTQKMTTLGGLSAGDPVNLEIDVIARYVARLAEARSGS